MSKQEEATKRWTEARHMTIIGLLIEQSMDYTYPAGQAQAGMQFATVEVPWLLEEVFRLQCDIIRLKGQLIGTQGVESVAQSA